MTAVPEDVRQDDASWRLRAACRGEDPEIFFPERGEATREAKSFCDRCEVRGDCLEFALSHVEKQGIWGGLSERQRLVAFDGAGVRKALIAHGTHAGYASGCRCGACRVAERAWIAQAPPPPPLRSTRTSRSEPRR